MVDRAALALFRRDEDGARGRRSKRERRAIVLELEDVDATPRYARPEHADSIQAETAVDDAVRVNVGKLVTKVERDIDSIGNRKRSVITQDRRKRTLLRSVSTILGDLPGQRCRRHHEG